MGVEAARKAKANRSATSRTSSRTRRATKRSGFGGSTSPTRGETGGGKGMDEPGTSGSPAGGEAKGAVWMPLGAPSGALSAAGAGAGVGGVFVTCSEVGAKGPSSVDMGDCPKNEEQHGTKPADALTVEGPGGRVKHLPEASGESDGERRRLAKREGARAFADRNALASLA